MEMEEGLYAQVVMLRRKDLNLILANRNKNESKFKFQGQYARSQRWFDLDFDWIELNSSTREPNFYKKRFKIYDDTLDTNTFKFFQVTMGNSNVRKYLSFTMMPQCSSIVRSH